MLIMNISIALVRYCSFQHRPQPLGYIAQSVFTNM